MVSGFVGSASRVAMLMGLVLAASAGGVPSVAGAAGEAPLSLRPTGADAVGGVLADGDGRLGLSAAGSVFKSPVTVLDPVRGNAPKSFAAPCDLGELADFHRGELLWVCPAAPGSPVPPDVRPGFLTDVTTGTTTSLPDPRPAFPRFEGIVRYGQIGQQWAAVDADAGRGLLRKWINRTTGEIREDVAAASQYTNPDKTALTARLCPTVRRVFQPEGFAFKVVPFSSSGGWYAASGSFGGEGGRTGTFLMRCGHPPIVLSRVPGIATEPVVGDGFVAWAKAKETTRGRYGPPALFVRALRTGRTRRLNLGAVGVPTLYVAGPRLYALVGRSLKRVALGRL